MRRILNRLICLFCWHKWTYLGTYEPRNSGCMVPKFQLWECDKCGKYDINVYVP